jgi:HSP20 family molecular chaperone IbpA
MSRMSIVNHPLLLGFEEIERLLDQVAKKSGDGYPPYNIERIPANSDGGESIRITLAVAGFTKDQLDVTIEDSQLIICGKQSEDETTEFLHRGIAARQFQRTFVLAEGIQVLSADLENGLLSINLARPQPERMVRRIDIREPVS